MDNNELERLYDGLVEILRSNGLGWVADQVADEVRIGKLSQRDIKTRQIDMVQPTVFSENYSQVRSSSVGNREVLARDEYPLKDRLRLLIAAIEEAVIHAGAMELQLVEQLVPHDGDLPGIEFYSEVTDETTMTINRSSARASG